ncbi:MAG: hypothetical protein AVO39_00685 [delta proteobacterium MLS_D]|jgi:electron transfer flavoprotein alpha subunit|nr:MAG: hypothetical protein AVO39_00685 [delta proteobacterium MLS_D]
MDNRKPESRIWVFAEQRSGQPVDVVFELLAKTRLLAAAPGWKVGALLIGHNVTGTAALLDNRGADEILVADDPALEDYRGGNYLAVVERAVRKHKPDVVLFGATSMGVDLAARLAARLRTGLSGHCVDLELSDRGELTAVIPWPGGDFLGRIVCPRRRPQMATVSPGIFDVPRNVFPKAKILTVDGTLDSDRGFYRIVEKTPEERKPGDLENARVVVVGGYGIGARENWPLVKELASLLGGVAGATRPPVDEGWVTADLMVGQSGRTVHPRLYIGVGVSGHLHHLVGVKGTELKVAVNQDPRAAIFDHCDLGLVGDYREIVPALIAALKKPRAAGDL